MERTRRNFSPEQKVNILREHLIERVPVSDVCDKHQIQPTLFYRWQKTFFGFFAGCSGLWRGLNRVFRSGRGCVCGSWRMNGILSRRI